MKRSKSNYDETSRLASAAMAQILVPIVDFAIRSGLSTQQMYATLREAAVKNVAAQQIHSGQRLNVSGISASTGVPRAEVARLLNPRSQLSAQYELQREHSTNRLLKEWHQHPDYQTLEGEPTDLRIYGNGATFETLVKKYGRGIPTRAALDELTRSGAVRMTSPFTVRVIRRIAIDGQLTSESARIFADRASKLLAILVKEVTERPRRSAIKHVSGKIGSLAQSAIFRKRLLKRATDFLKASCDSLHLEVGRDHGKLQVVEMRKVDVTIAYRETKVPGGPQKPTNKRKNLRREY